MALVRVGLVKDILTEVIRPCNICSPSEVFTVFVVYKNVNDSWLYL